MRTFASRPKRTALFLLGYALATAVMITLLSVGEAVLQQARDKDLFGGGDVILVPQGIDIESMKVGGVTALYYSIPQARFIVRQMLGSSRFEHQIGAVSPYSFSKLLYIRHDQRVETVFADGSLPEQEKALKEVSLPWSNTKEDTKWMKPAAGDFYHEIDHFHLPSVQSNELNRWAEWHYFNFEGDKFYGYLSIMASGNPNENNAHWIVSLQLVEPQYHHYSAEFPLRKEELPLVKVDYFAGRNRIQFADDHYTLNLNFEDRVSITAKLDFYPAPGLYFPPSYLAYNKTFESGYVIPAIRGKYRGKLRIGNRTYDFDELKGYHDHNWGIWQKTEWNWGHLFSKEYSILFGEIFVNLKSKGLFAVVFDQKGFISVFRPQALRFSDYRSGVPMKLELHDSKRFSALQLEGTAESYIPTKVDSSYFVQYKMNYRVKLEVDGKMMDFAASGNAETYVPVGKRRPEAAALNADVGARAP